MSSSEDVTWIQWFCGHRGNEFLVEVDEDYISDKFNLTGLSEQVPHYRRAIELILDTDVEDLDTISSKRTDSDLLEQAAELLYGLIHARYILSPPGLDAMVQKFKANSFGHCPRIFCSQQPTVPIGLSDIPGEDTVKLYCPKCNDVYAPKLTRHKGTDGAYFGTGFPHMLFMVHPEFRPAAPLSSFTPKLYGFMIHPKASEVQLKASAKLAVVRANQKAVKH